MPPTTRTPKGQLRVSEKDLERLVADAARTFGWMRYHTKFSVKSAAGWPDEALVRADRLIIAELKAVDNPPSPPQTAWLYALAAVPGIEVYLWRPTDIDEIAEVLR